eukprot:gene4940-6913_t
MGNLIQPSSRMGFTAVAVTTPNIELKQLTAILTSMQELNNEYVSLENFESILKTIDSFDNSDTELLLKLFTMFDFKGDNTVAYREYMISVILCFSTDTKSLGEKLKDSLLILDQDNCGLSSRFDVKKLLTGVNDIAAFFGDPVLTPEQIDNIISDMFSKIPLKANRALHDDCVEYLVGHTLIAKFLKGEGKIRYSLPN